MGQAESRQEKFWEACGFGETRLVEYYIKEGVDVDWISTSHKTRPIHAAALDKPDIITLLVKAGCDINAVDERGCTALHHASMKGYNDCVRLLLEYDADIDVQNKNGWTALHTAAYWGHADTVQMLLDHDADITITNNDDRLAIHEACRSKADKNDDLTKVVSSLLSVGSEIDTIATGEGGITTKFTCLMFACYHGHLDIVKELITAGCDVNLTGTSNWTALHWASDRGHIEICKYLLENGADPNLLAYRSETARDRAQTEELVELFNQFMPTPAVFKPPTDKLEDQQPEEITSSAQSTTERTDSDSNITVEKTPNTGETLTVCREQSSDNNEPSTASTASEHTVQQTGSELGTQSNKTDCEPVTGGSNSGDVGSDATGNIKSEEIEKAENELLEKNKSADT